jgi:hypothetical protein
LKAGTKASDQQSTAYRIQQSQNKQRKKERTPSERTLNFVISQAIRKGIEKVASEHEKKESTA